MRRPRVDQPPQLRTHPGSRKCLRGWGIQPGQAEQVRPLGLAQLEGAADGVEYFGGDVDIAALFEPGAPGDPDTGEQCDLFPAQAGGRLPVSGGPASPGANRARRIRRKSRSRSRRCCFVAATSLTRFRGDNDGGRVTPGRSAQWPFLLEEGNFGPLPGMPGRRRLVGGRAK